VVELKDGEEAASGAAAAGTAAAASPKAEERQEDRATVVPGLPEPVTAPEIETQEITSASLGFQDLDEITNAEGEVLNRHQASADDLFASLGTSDTIPAPSLLNVEREMQTRERSLPGESAPLRPPAPERPLSGESAPLRPPVPEQPLARGGTLPPTRVARVSSVPPSANGPRDSEIRIPTSGPSPAIWVLVAIVVGAAAAFLAVPRRPPEAPRPSVTTTVPPVASLPTPEMLPPAAESTSAASTPPAASASGATAPSPFAAEPDAALLASLQKGEGFLYVLSPLATNVYIYGLLAGTTNQRITTKCGPRFLRLGTRPGAWQTEGLVQIVKCGAFTRVEMAP
jgi:hypothetical protein